MKKTLLFIFAILGTLQLSAQNTTCMPDTTVVDTSGGLGLIFPLPYDEATMTGGIPVSACNNQPFEMIFTAKIPAEIELEQLPIPIGVNYIQINEDGVNGLPNGLTYACNPPDCKFDAGQFGCVIVYGTPNDMVGDYNLTLDLFLSTALLETDSQEPGNLFPGVYTLTVEEENSGTCFVVGTTNVLEENLNMAAVPNPLGDYTQINVNSGIHQTVFFEVHNLLGKELFVQPVDLSIGSNTIEYDASNLAEGMYIYSLRKGADVISKKMIVNR